MKKGFSALSTLGKVGVVTSAFLGIGGLGFYFYYLVSQKRMNSTGNAGVQNTNNQTVAPENAEVSEDIFKNKYNAHLIPDGLSNYRSAQMPVNVLENFIKKYNIKHIVRMNGDGVDGRHTNTDPITTMASEEALCNKLGCDFHFINAHKGYKEGEGYVESSDLINDVMKKGNVLIHCAHGADRTGAMVAAWLKKSGKMTDLDGLWAYTTQYNSWSSKLRNGTFFGSGYDDYADTFYPISLLKKSKWVNKQ
jgi:hypothetical protein